MVQTRNVYLHSSVYMCLPYACVPQCGFNTLKPRQNRRHFADDVFKCNFLNENVWILIKISLKLVLEGPINNIPAMVQIMAWRRTGDKPLSEPSTHICVTRIQWVNTLRPKQKAVILQTAFQLIFSFIRICCILIQISLKYVPRGLIVKNTALVQIMAWCRTGTKSLFAPMVA